MLGNRMAAKRIAGTDLILSYRMSQHLGFLINRHINYEPANREIATAHIKKGNLVFDIGANIGQYSLLFSRQLGDTGKLVCLEPDPENYFHLLHNLNANKCNNAKIVRKAVSDKEGKMTFYRDTTTGGRMGSLFQKNNLMYTGVQEEVETTTLQQLVDEFGIPDFIKIDVEGAEGIMLRGLNPELRRTVFLIEVRTETKAEVFEIFKALDMHIYLIRQGLHLLHRHEEMPEFGNILVKNT